MSDQQSSDPSTADAMARLQNAQAQYLAAMQDTWATLFKNYNDSIAAYVKAQQEQLKTRVCEPGPQTRS